MSTIIPSSSAHVHALSTMIPKKCGLCPSPCAICKRISARTPRHIHVANYDWSRPTYLCSDDEARIIINCTVKELRDYISSQLIAADLRHSGRLRLSYVDVIAVARQRQEAKALARLPGIRQSILSSLTRIIEARPAQHAAIDRWLVEYGLMRSQDAYVYGRTTFLLTPPVSGWYVYHLCKPDGTPFYIGKGAGQRMYVHAKQARDGVAGHKCNTIRKLWKLGQQIFYRIVFVTPLEDEAYLFEAEEIARFGLHLLTNVAPGTAPATLGKRRGYIRPELLTYAQVVFRLRGIKKSDIRYTTEIRFWADMRQRDLVALLDLAWDAYHERAIALIEFELSALKNLLAHQQQLF